MNLLVIIAVCFYGSLLSLTLAYFFSKLKMVNYADYFVSFAVGTLLGAAFLEIIPHAPSTLSSPLLISSPPIPSPPRPLSTPQVHLDDDKPPCHDFHQPGLELLLVERAHVHSLVADVHFILLLSVHRLCNCCSPSGMFVQWRGWVG